MKEKAKKIIDIINAVTSMADVQARYPDANGNTNTTWCNRALHRMLVRLNGRAELIIKPEGIGWTSANTMVTLARQNLTRIADGKAAQAIANEGDLAIAMSFNPAGSGHVAIVCPDENVYDEMHGVLIGQAGLENGIMTLRRGFGSWMTVVEFYAVPFKTE